MRESEASAGVVTRPAAGGTLAFLRRHGVYVGMLAWSSFGLIITDLSPHSAVQYWEITALLFGAIAIWRVAQGEGAGRPRLALQQVGHWGAFLVAMFLLHTKQVAAVLTPDALGLVMLMLLALATFLNGLYVDARFCIVGVLLAIGVVLLAALANALPLLLLVVLACMAAMFLLRRFLPVGDRLDAA